MSINMRKIPVITGENATNFLKRERKNEKLLKEKVLYDFYFSQKQLKTMKDLDEIEGNKYIHKYVKIGNRYLEFTECIIHRKNNKSNYDDAKFLGTTTNKNVILNTI